MPSNSDSSRTLIGAVTAGTTAAADPPAAPAPADPEQRRYRLLAGETIPEGIRRVADTQLAEAAVDLGGVHEADLGPAVHAARKRVKRVRAALRLSRSAIGDSMYRTENRQLRTIAAQLSTARDTRALLETLAGVEERVGDALAPDATVELRARLRDEHERALDALKEEGIDQATAQALEAAADRTTQWTFDRDDFRAIKPELRRIYRRGRRLLRAARKEREAEHLHEFRKRAKDLWHASQLLHAAHPKRMKRLSRGAHELADLLGDHHDLSVLRDYVEVHPHHFEDAGTRDALLLVIDGRSDTLRRRALKVGRQVYKRSPKRFADDVERGWRTRVRAA
ncbi:MAG: CHAD domain-containing protein [Actinomycetota bacterium]|nr:CHAD domain-containing protein [Actinomycetota bacterium]